MAPVEAPLADIDWIGQDLVHRPHAKARAEPRSHAARVQGFGNLLDAKRPTRCFTVEVELEDQPHSLCFDRVDDEALFCPVSTFLDVRDGVAEWHARAVVKALTSVLLHRSQHMLGVLAALIFVEQRDHLPHHHLRGIIAQLLGDRH
ncbi:hypothetical protein XH88_10140 [Bradyrhizobium sp. CCBAU 51627]|nr:hypothetical protein [Bradyrhizobium sp. CCBAU 51627]